ncbi:probable Histidine biosynthesis trifunctional protein [Saccharomycodes ludwigii]|uniref:Histidine biosynthesis trifunctional protein n=1 Tax=Saccharomycodes ludwigii TaxID=36035 RepID=A0A376B2Z2_9ASCO|nr:hypothetical protein SCDLUD_003853 [Saccharomycodes ludwigii]KAH3899573.1 hypothetical protein SCDLUD_003853 [Saccharomycodes ludwigii]SSD59047.1 probable Histidine biosynthesis trifunctional protein [Saccharomycodes ludwigii]
MGLPFAPLYSSIEDIEKYINKYKYTGNAVLDNSKISVEQFKSFISKYCTINTIYAINVSDSNTAIELLNNGVYQLVDFDVSTSTDIPASRLISSSKDIKIINPGATDLSAELLKYLKTDRADGLYTTVVVDEYERCLGLVYSSKESIEKAISLGQGIYYSRSRNEVWYKGATSGHVQELLRFDFDCDGDALKFVVKQSGEFCHVPSQKSCFGSFGYGFYELESVLKDRLVNAAPNSYTRRLFNDEELLHAKIREEAQELVDAKDKDEISWECADLIYFAFVKLIKNGVSLKDVEKNLQLKNLKTIKRKGDAKPEFLVSSGSASASNGSKSNTSTSTSTVGGPIHLNVVKCSDKEAVEKAFVRPIQDTESIMSLVKPIVENVKTNGDKAILEYTSKFDKVELTTPILEAPFPEEYSNSLSDEIKGALDLSIANVEKFHKAQLQLEVMNVETQPGVICSRFPRPIEKVGCYIPGGTAILPSTALMLGVPAKVANCKEIVFASPPGKNGKLSAEVVYVASKVGCSKIVMAGGAQAVAAMAYGTESVPKVDKILGPGNQFVTAAKMLVNNDTSALCSIDMPAGPSEVLVIADNTSDVDFVASDLLSQAEHGVDSQVILVGVNLSDDYVTRLQKAVDQQANNLPRVEIVRKCIEHSTIVLCNDYESAFEMSNKYAPEHLILQIENAEDYVKLVDNAGSVFVGAYTPESCGDYSSGTNHTLPTYGYARQYSGVNTSTFQKFITAQYVTPKGLDNIGKAVMCVAKVEGLDGHRNAVKIRMSKLGLLPKHFV